MRPHIGIECEKLALPESVERNEADHARVVGAARERRHRQTHALLTAHLLVCRTQRGVRSHAAAQAERSAMVKDMLLGLIFGGVGCMNLLRSILSGSADNIRPRAMTSWRKN
jgi:hypothetical protein